MKTTVIHHSADYDGLFCREIAKKFLPDAELIGWDYGDSKIPVPEGIVYILDLSPECLDFTGQEQKGITYPCDWLVWIDHHKSAMEKFSEKVPGYRIDGVAACRLAWQWFEHHAHLVKSGYHNPDGSMQQSDLPKKQDYVDRKVEEPEAVRLAGEYDIWDKRNPAAELLQHGLKSKKLTEFDWEMLLDGTVDSAIQGTGMEFTNSQLAVTALLEKGRVVEYVRAEEYKEVIQSQGFNVQFEGLTFLACCSHELDIRSHLFAAGVEPEHDALFGFTYTGKDWRVSLYHAPGKEHHDLSLIAVKYGGGGHRGACGFRTKSLPFLNT